ncbi:chromosome partitioning protein [Cellulomonas sp. 179-A 9B4 NHS]|uniref:chromosome partitioning protein n=1 Tax=Cellulomonas sp. 179-A 9B4 NHS TaxID=3142379 RepID=UPI00399F2523
MSEELPATFDPQQPDLPSLGVDPDPVPEEHDGEAPTLEPLDDGDDDGRRGTP